MVVTRLRAGAHVFDCLGGTLARPQHADVLRIPRLVLCWLLEDDRRDNHGPDLSNQAVAAHPPLCLPLPSLGPCTLCFVATSLPYNHVRLCVCAHSCYERLMRSVGDSHAA